MLDSIIYLPDGATIDTNSNIMTRRTARNTTRRPARNTSIPPSIIQMANGAYLDTKNNILTMSDGTQIDTVTGLKISVTA